MPPCSEQDDHPLVEERLIVGLGNPGAAYEETRHNLGFMVIQRLAQSQQWTMRRGSFKNGRVAQGVIDAHPVCLLMPLTYMNRSGGAVKSMVQDRHLAASKILVICDDLNLPYGQMRLRAQGRNGGHNGLSSIDAALQTQAYARLRLGIGRPRAGQDPSAFVLDRFTRQEQSALADFLDEAVDCSLVWLREGTDRAMERFNQKR